MKSPAPSIGLSENGSNEDKSNNGNIVRRLKTLFGTNPKKNHTSANQTHRESGKKKTPSPRIPVPDIRTALSKGVPGDWGNKILQNKLSTQELTDLKSFIQGTADIQCPDLESSLSMANRAWTDHFNYQAVFDGAAVIPVLQVLIKLGLSDLVKGLAQRTLCKMVPPTKKTQKGKADTFEPPYPSHLPQVIETMLSRQFLNEDHLLNNYFSIKLPYSALWKLTDDLSLSQFHRARLQTELCRKKSAAAALPSDETKLHRFLSNHWTTCLTYGSRLVILQNIEALYINSDKSQQKSIQAWVEKKFIPSKPSGNTDNPMKTYFDDVVDLHKDSPAALSSLGEINQRLEGVKKTSRMATDLIDSQLAALFNTIEFTIETEEYLSNALIHFSEILKKVERGIIKDNTILMDCAKRLFLFAHENQNVTQPLMGTINKLIEQRDRFALQSTSWKLAVAQLKGILSGKQRAKTAAKAEFKDNKAIRCGVEYSQVADQPEGVDTALRHGNPDLGLEGSKPEAPIGKGTYGQILSTDQEDTVIKSYGKPDTFIEHSFNNESQMQRILALTPGTLAYPGKTLKSSFTTSTTASKLQGGSDTAAFIEHRFTLPRLNIDLWKLKNETKKSRYSISLLRNYETVPAFKKHSIELAQKRRGQWRQFPSQ